MVNCWDLFPGFCQILGIKTQPEVLVFDNLEMRLNTLLTVSNFITSEMLPRDFCSRTWAIKASSSSRFDLVHIFSFTQSHSSSTWIYQSFFRAKKKTNKLSCHCMSLIPWSVSCLSEHLKPLVHLVVSSLQSTPSSLSLCGSLRTICHRWSLWGTDLVQVVQ